MAAASIEIPLKSGEEVVELKLDQLPDADVVVNILTQEDSLLQLWIKVALEYYKQYKFEDFVVVLDKSLSEAKSYYDEYERDKVHALDLLAAHYVQLASQESIKEKKDELFFKANNCYNKADNILYCDADVDHILGRAHCHLLEGNNINQAETQFNFVLNQSPGNIPALLGKACISYNKKDYKAALIFYKTALTTNPKCPASVRLGMGHCFMKLGNTDKARLAYERALQLDPKCVGAMVGLGVLDTQQTDSVKDGVQMLVTAFNIDSKNAMILNHLANHYFFRKDYSRTIHLAQNAINNTQNESMRAESCYHLARAFHVQEDYDRAFQYYYKATDFAPARFVLPYFGLGQMYIQRGDTENAAKCLEKVLKVEPSNYETMRILGSLYVNSRSQTERNRGKDLLQKVTEQFPDDIEAWIELAQILEQSDLQGALTAYQTTVDLFKEQVQSEIPPEILNNIGSLLYRMGKLEDAKNYFEESLARSEIETLQDPLYYSSISVTATYNLARVYEALFQFSHAERMYKDTLKNHPNYIDCYLRLGCMAKGRGQIYEASDWFKDALRINTDHPDAWTLLGNLHMSKMELLPGQKKFERILDNPATAADTYASLALANMWLQTSHYPSKDKQRVKRHQERALDIYTQILRDDPQNIWAANGIGAVIAHQGHLNEARDVFAQVREATADFCDVWMNIAHIYVEQRQHMSAVQMYENCLAKFFKHHDVTAILYLARAYSKTGKLREARAALLKARHIAPHDTVLLFNTALVLQRLASEILKDEKSSLQTVLQGVTDLGLSLKFFEHLSGVADSTKYDVKQAGIEARRCQDLLSQASYHVARARRLDEEVTSMRKKQEEERAAFRLKQRMEMKLLKERREQDAEKQLQRRAEYKEKTKHAIIFVEKSPEMKSKNGHDKETVSDSDSDGAAPSEYEKKKPKERKKSAAGGSKRRKVNSGIENQSKSRKKKAPGKRRGSEDGVKMEDMTQKLRIVSKATVSTSESD